MESCPATGKSKQVNHCCQGGDGLKSANAACSSNQSRSNLPSSRSNLLVGAVFQIQNIVENFVTAYLRGSCAAKLMHCEIQFTFFRPVHFHRIVPCVTKHTICFVVRVAKFCNFTFGIVTCKDLPELLYSQTCVICHLVQE